jgi:hypothetical protein
MIATATVALGWYYALVLNQRGRLVLFLLAAVAVHALWNTSALLLGGVSMLSSLNPDLALFTTALVGLVLILLIALFGGFLFWLRALVRWAQPPPVEIITPQHSAGLLVENAKEF